MLTDDHDELTTRLRAADPVRAETAALPDPEGPAGLRILTRAHQRARRGRLRRLVVIPAVAAVVMGGATAGGVSLLRGDGHVADASGVECVEPLLDDGVRTHGLVVIKDPVAFCRDLWEAFYGFEPVGDVTACAPADGEGLVRVYVGGREVCETNGAIAYLGPTDEQHRLSAFERDLRYELLEPYPERPSFAEIEAMVEDLLTEYGLDRWSVKPLNENALGTDCYGGDTVGPTGWCFATTYDEPRRTLFIGTESWEM